MNYYITLYVLKNKSKETYHLLYGFIVDTNFSIQQDWEPTKILSRLKLYKLTCIMDFKNYNHFINNLSQITIFDYSIDGEFIKRDNLISGITYLYEENKPTNKLSNLTELWNIDKNNLMKNIKNLYSTKNTTESIKDLLNTLYEKTGINFKKAPHRFGNLEIYREKNYNDFIKYKLNEDNTDIIVYVEEPLEANIYIKVYSENNKRCLINQLKILKKGEKEVNFKLNENSFHLMIEVWDEDGDIIFFQNSYLMRRFGYTGHLTGNQYKMRDEWSKNIGESTKHNLDEIETVRPVKSIINSTIDPQYKNDLVYRTILRSQELFNSYEEKQTKGKFIIKQDDRKGEINSYRIIKELIDSSSNDSILIIDPYFSVKSIGKMLGRIEHNKMKVEIITSLTNIDSDTGEENKNNKEECKEFVLRNKNMLHKNLKIINILSGKKEAFHDRYLIRKLNTGEIDGYILSNSINSMAQKYPFLVSPLETDIVKEILTYIKKLTGEISTQEAYYKNLTRETIYDSKSLKSNTSNSKSYLLPSIITGIEDIDKALNLCIEKKYILDDRLTVNEEKYDDIINILLENWDYNPVKIIKSIGELLYKSILNQTKIVSLIDKFIVKEDFIEILKNVIKEMECKADIPSYRIDSIEKQIYLILNNEAKGNYKFLYKHPENLFYGEYLICLYTILYNYSFDEYIKLLKEIKSPMMFNKLIKYMNFSHFNYEEYRILIDSDIPCTYEFAALWLLDESLKSDKKLDMIIDEIIKLEEKDTLHQGCIILSELTFIYRIEDKFIEEDIYIFIEKFSNIFNSFDMNADSKFKYLKIFEDKDLENELKFKIYMLDQIPDKELIDLIVEDLMDKFIKYYQKSHNTFNDDSSKTIISYLLKIINLEPQKYLTMFYDLSKFGRTYYEYKEPLLEEINYKRWNELNNIYIWECNILLSLKKAGYDVEKYKMLLDNYE